MTPKYTDLYQTVEKVTVPWDRQIEQSVLGWRRPVKEAPDAQSVETQTGRAGVRVDAVGRLRKLHHRGGERVDWTFTFTAALYNIVRLRTLLAGTA